MLGEALKVMEVLFAAGHTLTGVTVILHSTLDGQKERNLFVDAGHDNDRSAIEAAWLLELARSGGRQVAQESS